MELKWWVVLLMLLFGGWHQYNGCLEEENFALLHLKPFFSHIAEVDNWPAAGGSSDCCQWERVECNTTSGRVIGLLNLTNRATWGDSVTYAYQSNGDIEYWRISDRDYRYFNASLFLPFAELKSLYLDGNQIAGFERLSQGLDKLEILDLSVNYFNESILSSLSEFSSLKSLYLGENKFTRTRLFNGIKELSKLNNLETLDLNGNKLGNDILSYLGGITSLKSLYLIRCGLKGIVDMQESNNLTKLKELYLRDNEIENLRFLQETERKFQLINLEVLGLSYNLVNNSILAVLSAFSNLKSLYLTENMLEGVIDIKELDNLSNLEELQIGCGGNYNYKPLKDLLTIS
ncbi:hypothetical protein SCA6_000958 [Theobroma cacao]